MAEVKLVYPASGLTAPTSWGSKAQILKMMENINKNYGTYIQFASTESKLPKEMIASFIAVESGGNATAGASGHITQGLMQWNRSYAKSQLETELKLGRMTANEKNKLATYGIKFDANGKTRAITNADQLKPELNILIGTMLLGQLVDTDWVQNNRNLMDEYVKKNTKVEQDEYYEFDVDGDLMALSFD